MTYLAIDPGRDTGWAVFAGPSRLVDCGVGNPRHDGIKYVVIELPQVYRAAQSKGDPNDLIKVAVMVGEYKERFASRGASVLLVHPHEWKGTIPKDVHHPRVWADLTPAEQVTARSAGKKVSEAKRHNMLDAIGIGAWAFRVKRW